MKKLFLLLIFVFFIFGCGKNADEPNLEIIKWGPDQTKIGEIPNKQPDGKMGVWIEVVSTEGFGDAVVLFSGKLSKTSVEPNLITAGILPEEIIASGEKTVEIKLLSTGKIMHVGTFRVTP